MPELPEVETIREGLNKAIVGKTTTELEIKAAKSFSGKKEDLLGQKIKSIERRAKVLFLELSNGKFLVCHLKLTGQLIFEEDKEGKEDQRYTVIIISFKGGGKLYFNDLRKFGWMKIMTKEEAEKEKAKFGLEAFMPNFTINNFNNLLARYPKKTIRDLLMEQDKIAGIGNIYASEILYEAGILPSRKVATLNEQDKTRLFIAIEKVLKRAIEAGGASPDSYRKIDGSEGDYMKKVMVYQQKECPKGHLIVRQKIKGRSSFFCPKCQK